MLNLYFNGKSHFNFMDLNAGIEAVISAFVHKHLTKGEAVGWHL